MKAFCITIRGHSISESGLKEVVASSAKHGNNFEIQRFDAIVPETVNSIMSETGLVWNYPWSGVITDTDTKLKKSAYGTRIKEKRIACSLSHFLLWEKCEKENAPYLILEHDAKFVTKLDYHKVLDSHYDIVGINDPHMATRKFDTFHSVITGSVNDIQDVPIIDALDVPQGLAGNSAYIIKPSAAKHLISLCYRYGLWPNDAIMCQQLVPNMGVTKTYYTKTQQLGSTTSS